jgi:predicted HTH domain antitoxin
MTLTLPDAPELLRIPPDDLRLELACALFAQGRLGKVTRSELAGVDFFGFQRILGERRLTPYSPEMLEEDLLMLRDAPRP